MFLLLSLLLLLISPFILTTNKEFVNALNINELVMEKLRHNNKNNKNNVRNCNTNNGLADPIAPPPGNYVVTCTNCCFDGEILSCTCKANNNFFQDTGIRVSQCGIEDDPSMGITNTNGQLTCYHM
jgi:hypothetical protein